MNCFGAMAKLPKRGREGVFDGLSVNGHVVTVNRSYDDHGQAKTMLDELHDTHGIEVQYDTDNSEDTIEFTDHKGNMTVLHFESKVDGDS